MSATYSTPPESYITAVSISTNSSASWAPSIVSCSREGPAHRARPQSAIREVVPGRGIVDYKAYLRNLARVPLEAPLMLEHFANDEEFQEGANYIRKQGEEIGVTFV